MRSCEISQKHLMLAAGSFLSGIFYKDLFPCDINPLRLSDAIWYHKSGSLLFQVMVWHLFGAKPLPEPILTIRPLWTNFNEIWIKIQKFSFKKMHFKMLSAKWQPFCLGRNVLNFLPISPMVCPFTSRRFSFPSVMIYRETSNISRTKSQNLNVSHLVLHLSLSNPLKPGVKSRMNM